MNNRKWARVKLMLLRLTGMDRRMIRDLQILPENEVKPGRLVEYYGRILLVEKNPQEVRTRYEIRLSRQASLTANDLMEQAKRDGRTESKSVDGQKTWVTYDHELVAMLHSYNMKEIEISEDLEGMPCEECDINRMSLPCNGKCNGKCKFHLISQTYQYATNQKMWNEIMLRRIVR